MIDFVGVLAGESRVCLWWVVVVVVLKGIVYSGPGLRDKKTNWGFLGGWRGGC